jgi:hypothetical protein
MSAWYRVFGSSDSAPEPVEVETFLAGSGAVRASWAADASGWYRGEITVGGGEPLVLERFLAEEKGIRGELNSWAGYLETREDNPHHQALMERVIQARQLLTLQPGGAGEALGEALCRRLAAWTNGFYQIDSKGFFAADGELLVPEG